MDKKPVEKPQRIFTDGEMITIRNNFKDNDVLRKAIRKVMLQLPLTEVDKKVVEGVKLNKPLVALLRKTFLPTLDPEAPFGQVIDLWMTLSIKDKSADQAYVEMAGRDILIDYLDGQLKTLESDYKPEINFRELSSIKNKEAMGAVADLTARNTAISHTELQLTVLGQLANIEEETPEELKKRLGLNSSK